jgi:hypothetical protein
MSELGTEVTAVRVPANFGFRLCAARPASPRKIAKSRGAEGREEGCRGPDIGRNSGRSDDLLAGRNFPETESHAAASSRPLVLLAAASF